MAEFRLDDLPIITADSIRKAVVEQGWDEGNVSISILPIYQDSDGTYKLPFLISPRSDLEMWDDVNSPKMGVSYSPDYEEWGELLTLSGNEDRYNQLVALTKESN